MEKTSQEIDKNSKEINSFKQVNDLNEHFYKYIPVDILENAKRSDTQCFERLVSLVSSDEFDIDVIDLKENTLLHYAILIKQPTLARALLGRQNIEKLLDHENINGATPLGLAIGNRYWELAEQLIKKGANVNVIEMYEGDDVKEDEEFYYKSPILHAAVELNMWELVELLIENKVDVNARKEIKDHFDKSVLWEVAVTHHQWELAQKLIRKGAYVNEIEESSFSSYYGTSVLWWAVRFQKIELARQLLNRGADVNVKAKSPENQNYGTSVLWWAVRFQEWEFVQELLKREIDVNATADSPDNQDYGVSVLWMAVCFQQWKLAEQLIREGACANVTPKAGAHCRRSILWMAINHEQPELVQRLINRGALVDAEIQYMLACSDCFDGINLRISLVNQAKNNKLIDKYKNDWITYRYDQGKKEIIENFEEAVVSEQGLPHINYKNQA